ncbi:MAG TPA: Atu4866 domain-containing protein [Dyella sp.]|nr:Atu4866 domain-containing protein [Dyella sp.]
MAATCPFPARPEPHEPPAINSHLRVGMWVTADGRFRHELLRAGRYDDARDRKNSAWFVAPFSRWWLRACAAARAAWIRAGRPPAR